jgi:hypothetical protein
MGDIQFKIETQNHRIKYQYIILFGVDWCPLEYNRRHKFSLRVTILNVDFVFRIKNKNQWGLLNG